MLDCLALRLDLAVTFERSVLPLGLAAVRGC